MARGNDAETAEAELRRDFGDYQRLDDLIKDHRASLDPRVQAAQGWGYDVDATEALDISTLKVEGGEVLSAAVRRNRTERLIIAVVEFPDGVYRKVGLDFPEGKAAKQEPDEAKGKAAATRSTRAGT